MGINCNCALWQNEIEEKDTSSDNSYITIKQKAEQGLKLILE